MQEPTRLIGRAPSVQVTPADTPPDHTPVDTPARATTPDTLYPRPTFAPVTTSGNTLQLRRHSTATERSASVTTTSTASSLSLNRLEQEHRILSVSVVPDGSDPRSLSVLPVDASDGASPASKLAIARNSLVQRAAVGSSPQKMPLATDPQYVSTPYIASRSGSVVSYQEPRTTSIESLQILQPIPINVSAIRIKATPSTMSNTAANTVARAKSMSGPARSVTSSNDDPIESSQPIDCGSQEYIEEPQYSEAPPQVTWQMKTRQSLTSYWEVVLRYRMIIWTFLKRFAPPAKIDPNATWYIWWNRIILLCQMEQIIVMPFIMSFVPGLVGDSFHMLLVFGICCFIFDMALLCHVFFKTRLHTQNEWGEEIDLKVVVKDYMIKSLGIFELLGALPWDFIALAVPCEMMPSGWGCHQIRLWALFRVFKSIFGFPLSTVFNANLPGLPIPISRLCKSLAIFMLIGHIDTCLFWLVEISLPPGTRWIDETAIPLTNPEISWTTQYPVTLLGSLASLVLKLRTAYMPSECLFVVFEFIAGILAYGTLFAEIFAVLRMFDESATKAHQDVEHRLHMDNVREYMRENSLPPEVQDQVLAYKEIQYRRVQGMDEAHLFDDIPRSVQQKIQEQLYMELVRSVPLFGGVDDERIRQAVCFAIKPLMLLDGWILFHAGDEGQEMFFIKSGNIEICIGPEQRVVATLGPGNFFGELALFDSDSGKRTATTRGKGQTELCVLSKHDFQQILSRFPSLAERVAQAVIARREERAKNEVKAAEARRQEAEAAAALAAQTIQTRSSAMIQRVINMSSKMLVKAIGSTTSLTVSTRQGPTPGKSGASILLPGRSSVGMDHRRNESHPSHMNQSLSIQVDDENSSRNESDSGTDSFLEESDSDGSQENVIVHSPTSRRASRNPSYIQSNSLLQVGNPSSNSNLQNPLLKADRRRPSQSSLRSFTHNSQNTEAPRLPSAMLRSSKSFESNKSRQSITAKDLEDITGQKDSSGKSISGGGNSRGVRFKSANDNRRGSIHSDHKRKQRKRRPSLKTLTNVLKWQPPAEAILPADPLYREAHLKAWKQSFWRRHEAAINSVGRQVEGRARGMSV
ncbi:hypothetical protein SmJEL517_g01693 [Synchytrium microbalum]|uniref:Cyclic nucleotide-binding domain-containing protein n=1 Tax=Synchytrium microbalum TaxID=1806994 RepID=A0A507C8C7_9FUNG|nr:uncharacterized protein SmJEL517_g01693 [Synchytrium microbalum]TPX35872.1 hypothetical protein SmJEL517_g01693 [Synchytrium microbalum]